jgi:hypothetical protein
MTRFVGKYSDGKIMTPNLKNLRAALHVFPASAGVYNTCECMAQQDMKLTTEGARMPHTAHTEAVPVNLPHVLIYQPK